MRSRTCILTKYKQAQPFRVATTVDVNERENKIAVPPFYLEIKKYTFLQHVFFLGADAFFIKALFSPGCHSHFIPVASENNGK